MDNYSDNAPGSDALFSDNYDDDDFGGGDTSAKKTADPPTTFTKPAYDYLNNDSSRKDLSINDKSDPLQQVCSELQSACSHSRKSQSRYDEDDEYKDQFEDPSTSNKKGDLSAKKSSTFALPLDNIEVKEPPTAPTRIPTDKPKQPDRFDYLNFGKEEEDNPSEEDDEYRDDDFEEEKTSERKDIHEDSGPTSNKFEQSNPANQATFGGGLLPVKTSPRNADDLVKVGSNITASKEFSLNNQSPRPDDPKKDESWLIRGADKPSYQANPMQIKDEKSNIFGEQRQNSKVQLEASANFGNSFMNSNSSSQPKLLNFKNSEDSKDPSAGLKSLGSKPSLVSFKAGGPSGDLKKLKQNQEDPLVKKPAGSKPMMGGKKMAKVTMPRNPSSRNELPPPMFSQPAQKSTLDHSMPPFLGTNPAEGTQSEGILPDEEVEDENSIRPGSFVNKKSSSGMPSNGFTETVKESETDRSVPKPTYNYKPPTKEQKEVINRELTKDKDAVSDTSKYSAVVFSVPVELQEKSNQDESEDEDNYEEDFEDAFEKSNGDGTSEGDKTVSKKESPLQELPPPDSLNKTNENSELADQVADMQSQVAPKYMSQDKEEEKKKNKAAALKSSPYANSPYQSNSSKKGRSRQKKSPSRVPKSKLPHYQIPKNINPISALELAIKRAKEQYQIAKVLREKRRMDFASAMNLDYQHGLQLSVEEEGDIEQ